MRAFYINILSTYELQSRYSQPAAVAREHKIIPACADIWNVYDKFQSDRRSFR